MIQQATDSFRKELQLLEAQSNLRQLPDVEHCGKDIICHGKRMLNLSSNDYLGLATDTPLRKAFLETLTPERFLPSSSSSRLLTGNFSAYTELEDCLCRLFGAESALVFSSGYHTNTGILPAVCNAKTLILADKLVHASLIDGIRLSSAQHIRYKHNNYEHLESLLRKHRHDYERIIIVTESIFSMDGDEADLRRLAGLKKEYPQVLLYVDEAHAIGVRGDKGLGCAEEQGCVEDIDFLIGTFGKALASVGGYIICKKEIRDYLINKMRTLIFTTALPPINLMWSSFVMERLEGMRERRNHLENIRSFLKEKLMEKGYECTSASHIIPVVTGDSRAAILKAEEMQRKGFYALPVRPPTVPEGSSRIRLSLTASLSKEEVEQFADIV
ncbi:MAG: 8-amino-7-oxononanoate synthase [Tannerellaceae bacterium]|jgi:8-amino-7-oxononanoate synthase|nr:8-amino-7-oxononanoate synthase [Tannerellaceae bacterium]